MPDARNDSTDITGALLVVGEERGVCWVTVPEAWDSRFEAIGRDDDGAFLRTDGGDVHRIPRADADTVDDLIALGEVTVQELDGRGNLVGAEYQIEALAPGYSMAMGA